MKILSRISKSMLQSADEAKTLALAVLLLQ